MVDADRRRGMCALHSVAMGDGPIPRRSSLERIRTCLERSRPPEALTLNADAIPVTCCRDLWRT
jgi:hypothetical protein